MARSEKIRLDQVLVANGLVPSRQQAKGLIMAGKILVDGQPVDKPGTRVCPAAAITVRGKTLRYVSRGGLKLEAALKAFRLAVFGWVCLDVGASTGGFTDCLLQHGAAQVFSVDVGYGQLAWPLRKDPRVVAIERTNIRYMPVDIVAAPVDLITIDVSFISLKIAVPAALKFLKKGGSILALIKPQFEVGRANVGKGGVVRDPSLHNAVIADLEHFFTDIHLSCDGCIPSPILGPKGNREFIMRLTPTAV